MTPEEQTPDPDELAEQTRDETRRVLVAAPVLFGAGLLASLVVRISAVRRVDLDLTTALHQEALRDEQVAALARLVSWVGNPFVLAAMVVVVAAVLAFRSERRIALWLVAVTALGGITESLTKVVVGRSRPDLEGAFVDTATKSFPSGHAMNTTVVLGAIAVAVTVAGSGRHRRVVPQAAAFAALTAIVVGLSRPLLGVHFVSDIVAGWALGLLWLVLTRPTRVVDDVTDTTSERATTSPIVADVDA